MIENHVNIIHVNRFAKHRASNIGLNFEIFPFTGLSAMTEKNTLWNTVSSVNNKNAFLKKKHGDHTTVKCSVSKDNRFWITLFNFFFTKIFDTGYVL